MLSHFVESHLKSRWQGILATYMRWK